MNKKYIVHIIESERSWGQKLDEVKEFDTAAEAKSFVKGYNEKYNNLPVTPSWYMYADYIG